MNDPDKSLGDEKTYGGTSPKQPDPKSLGAEMTFGGLRGAEDALLDDDMEIVDLSKRYTIESTLGKGGMGEVLLATDNRLKRKVAIKRILGDASRSKTALDRFLTEAQSIAALNHANIVQIYDYGRDEEGPFLIIEYVDGHSLLDTCKMGPMSVERAVDITCQLCDGLGKAHDAGIIHRDIKPANILITKDGVPKLTDFGLAKAETADTGMTMAGAVLGTLDFMPPEQRKDAALTDARSDLWSLAATLYQMVTGEPPRVIDLDLVPSELRDCMARSLKSKKDDRYQVARDFKHALFLLEKTNSETPKELPETGVGECPDCNVKNDISRKFCSGCAAPLRVNCLKCEEPIPVWDKVCGECGGKQKDLKIAKTQFTEAQSHAQVFDFNSAIQALEVVPDIAFTSELESFRNELIAKRDETESLLKEIKNQIKEKDYLGLLEKVNRAIELKGNRADLIKLQEGLGQRELKSARKKLATAVRMAKEDGIIDEPEIVEILKMCVSYEKLRNNLGVQSPRDNDIENLLNKTLRTFSTKQAEHLAFVDAFTLDSVPEEHLSSILPDTLAHILKTGNSEANNDLHLPPEIDNWTPSESDAANLLTQAFGLINEGSIKSGIRRLEEADKLTWFDPSRGIDDNSLHFCLAEAHSLNGDQRYKDALEFYNQGYKAGLQEDYMASKTSYIKAVATYPGFLWSANNLAWLYATCNSSSVRDGRLALRYSLFANRRSNWHSCFFIGTLAGCYAEIGDFDKAIQCLDCQVMKSNRDSQSEQMLRCFHSKKAWRE